MMITPGDLFESTNYPCQCGRSNLEKLNGLLICPLCGFYEKGTRASKIPIEAAPRSIDILFNEIQDMLGKDNRTIKRERVKKRPAKRIDPKERPIPTPRKGILYKLIDDGRFGIAYDEDQKHLPSKKTEAILKMVDENNQPIMSERFHGKQAVTWKKKTELEQVSYVY